MTDFETIYAQYYDGVYKYVFSLCRNEADAEEITQEAFFKAMEHLDQFQGQCKLYVWLCQIAKNTYFTFARRRSRSTTQSSSVLSDSAGPSLEDSFLEQETAQELHQLLHRLREPYQEVFSLRVFGELSFSQIGALFGKTDSWARLIFYRAKQEIRRNYHEYTL